MLSADSEAQGYLVARTAKWAAYEALQKKSQPRVSVTGRMIGSVIASMTSPMLRCAPANALSQGGVGTYTILVRKDKADPSFEWSKGTRGPTGRSVQGSPGYK